MSTPTTLNFKRISQTVPSTPFRICVLGDSITAFGWYQYLATQCAAAQITATADPTGNFPYTKLSSATGPHIWFNSGIAGDDCTNFLHDTIAVRVTAYKPDLVIIACGVNCQQHAGPDPVGVGTTGIVTTDSVCTTNHALIISQIQAQNPLAQIVWVGGWLNGEQWPAGINAWDTGANSIAAKNAITQAACAGAVTPIMYIDVRSPTFVLLPTYNPTNQPTGIFTNIGDGIHPSVTPQTAPIAGQQLWANIVFPLCVFS